MERAARFSGCRRDRRALRRIGDPSPPAVRFIVLDPSMADATSDGHTARVCMGHARRPGFGTLLGNLFAWRSTDPAGVRRSPATVGRRNDVALRVLQRRAGLVVCAWGDPGAFTARDAAVPAFLRAPHCLVRLRSGRPGHPLYKSATLKPVPP